MRYKTTNIEMLTASNGNTYKRATFTGQDGTVIEKIGTFADSPIYNSVIEGGVVEGDIRKNTKGYNNFYPFNANPQSTGGFKGGGGAMKAVEKKNENVTKNMDRKEDGIKTSSTFRAAYETTIAQLSGQEFTNEEFQKQFTIWRRYYMKAFDLTNNLTSAGTEVPFPDKEEVAVEEEWSNVPF